MKILSICGSPRKGNSETIILKLKEIFEKGGVENEIILLREKNIARCDGCVEFCNKNLNCHKKDDMPELFDKIKKADAYVFVYPNYFNMPPGIFKNFMDRMSIFYPAQLDFLKKKTIVVCVGADTAEKTNSCLNNFCDSFCNVLKMIVVAKKSFQANSELRGEYDDIFTNKYNDNVVGELEKMAKTLR